MFHQTWTLLLKPAISQPLGVFMSCLVELDISVTPVFCPGENPLLGLHKSSLEALSAFWGIPRPGAEEQSKSVPHHFSLPN